MSALSARHLVRLGVVPVTLVIGFGAVTATSAQAIVSPHAVTNLIKNGDAESAAGSSDGATVPTPKWTLTTGTTFTAVQYGASGGFPMPSDPGPKNRGANFLAGGSGEPLEIATQTASLQKYRTAIDAGTATYLLKGYLGGYSSQEDNAVLEVEFARNSGEVLGTATIGPVTATDRGDATGLLLRQATGAVPVGARRAILTLTLTREDGSYNDGYADNLVLNVSTG